MCSISQPHFHSENSRRERKEKKKRNENENKTKQNKKEEKRGKTVLINNVSSINSQSNEQIEKRRT